MFAEACRARNLPGVEKVVSLSGGFDSRAVAACFHAVEIPFRCATYLDHVGKAAADVPVARRVAELLGVEWTLFKLDPPTSRDVLKLLRMKNGMNPLAMAFILRYLEAVRDSSDSPLLFVSGEEVTLHHYLNSPVPLASLEELTEHLISRYQKFSLDDVSALTGLAPTDILDELQDNLTEYPERDCNQKYLHFVMLERGFKWISEGEDRNRCYFWNTAPFFSFDFFNYSLNCSDEQKLYYRLYHEFLMQLAPAAATLEHAAIGLPSTSTEFQVALKAARLLDARPDLYKKMQTRFGFVKRYDNNSMMIKYLTQQLAQGDIFEYLSPAALQRIVAECASYTAVELEHLFTLTSIIEDLTTGKSVLEV
jgi:hypothetical protein